MMYPEFCKKHHHSFASRLTWRIMFTTFLVMALVSCFVYFITRHFVAFALVGVFSNWQLEHRAQEMEKSLSEVYVAAVNTVPDIENSLGRPDRLQSIIERIVELNPNIHSCGISFRENYYPQKGRWFCPYATRRDSTVAGQTIGGPTQDYLQEEWFVEALKADTNYWAKPFFESTDGRVPLVAYLMPIRDELGQTVAILGVDYELHNCSDDLIDEFLDSYCFVIDPQGTYLLHPDQERIISDNYFNTAGGDSPKNDERLGRQMVNGMRFGLPTFFMVDGEKVFVSHRALEHTPWSMAYVLPYYWAARVGYTLGGTMLLIITLGLIVVFFVGRRVIRKAASPLVQLAQTADEVAKGNIQAQLPTIKHNDEIRLMRDSFENMQQSLVSYIEELRQVTAQTAAMESEMRVAHDIQMSMLPKTFPPYPDRSDLDIYGSVTPAKGVGGDLFDFYIRDERLFFCIGDVSGKGVPASLFMAVTRSLFRNVSTHISEPAQIVTALNKAQSEGNETGMFVTLFVGVLDLHTGVLDFCNAGHDDPLLLGSQVEEMQCESNIVIGLFPDFEFVQQQATLAPGTTIFLYTDGLNEAEDISHGQFGDDRIMDVARRLLQEHRHQPQHLVDSMTEAVHAFVGDAEQSDDLTMLAIQYK
ncbi:MAG: SpoIIE family protein phosphatase [Prevotella sp.]|nr:SpoIIE family protein phosphatase [Prevotella sp.]